MLIVKKVYYKYFAKDKMLRHVSQHLEVAVIGFTIVYLLTKFPINLKNIIIFIIFSYIPDIDAVISVFIWSRKIPTAKKIKKLLTQLRIKEALSYATKNHKKLNRMFLHNVIVYLILSAVFVISIIRNQTTLIVILASSLTHLTFDLLDDIKQLGNIGNWLWVFRRS